jgi:hypothetical protein
MATRHFDPIGAGNDRQQSLWKSRGVTLSRYPAYRNVDKKCETMNSSLILSIITFVCGASASFCTPAWIFRKNAAPSLIGF